MSEQFYFTMAPGTGLNGTQIPPVSVNDPRTPPPAPDIFVLTEPGLPPVIVGPSGNPVAPSVQPVGEEDVPKVKASIYSAKGDLFVFSVEDLEGDPIESVKTTAENVDAIVRPLMEACGVKVVDRTAGDLKDALAVVKRPVRMKRTTA